MIVEGIDLTEAEVRVIRYLAQADEFSGGSLVDFYQRCAGLTHATTDRRHAWRRAGGRVLAGLKRKGLVRIAPGSRYHFDYIWTDVGQRVAEAVSR